MPVTYKKIASVTVTSAGGQAALDFTNIPATHDDLLFFFSCRENVALNGSYVVGSFNSNTSNYSTRELFGNGSTVASNTYTSGAASRLMGYTTGNSATSSTFGNSMLYIPNYKGSTNKSWSVDGVSENNSTSSVQVFLAGLWSNTSAITSASFTAFNGNNWMQYSTATLYGISKS